MADPNALAWAAVPVWQASEYAMRRARVCFNGRGAWRRQAMPLFAGGLVLDSQP